MAQWINFEGEKYWTNTIRTELVKLCRKANQQWNRSKRSIGTNKRVVTGVFFYPKNTMNKSWKRLLSKILSLLPSCKSSWARSSVYSQLCTSVLGDITMHQLSVGRATWIQCGACIKMLMLIPESPVFMFKRICAVQTGWTTKTLSPY